MLARSHALVASTNNSFRLELKPVVAVVAGVAVADRGQGGEKNVARRRRKGRIKAIAMSVCTPKVLDCTILRLSSKVLRLQLA